MGTKNEINLNFFGMVAQAPISFHGSYLLCKENHKNDCFTALQIMVDILEAYSL